MEYILAQSPHGDEYLAKPVGCVTDDEDWDMESCSSTELPDIASQHVDSGDDDDESACRKACKDALVIFDWDDTILPTTWLASQGLNLHANTEATDDQKEELATLAKWAAETLNVAKTLGTVVIVTNAEDRWIQLSCEKFLPSLVESLSNVRTLSARSTYEPQGIVSPTEWKVHAFEKEIETFCRCLPPGQRASIVSIGDSQYEREALFRTTSNRPTCFSKSVKFIVRPTLERLTEEHETFCGELRQIIDQDGSVDRFLQ